MDYGHPLRFGISLRTEPHNGTQLAELARHGEELGFDLLTISAGADGVGAGGGQVATDAQPAPAAKHDSALDIWTTLSWIAGQTNRIQLLAQVTDSQHPAVLARAVASLDLLSAGRVEVILGDARPVGQLAEMVEILRNMWEADARSGLRFTGQHFEVRGAQRGPAPAHNISILIGGTQPDSLAYAGAEAEGWFHDDTVDSAPSAELDSAAIVAGRDPREIQRYLVIHDPAELTVPALASAVLDHGFANLIVANSDPVVLQQFASEVIPALRERVSAERIRRGIIETVLPTSRFTARRRAGIDYDQLPDGMLAIEPGDVRYAAVRSTYLRGGAPGLVLQPKTTSQVVQALAFARRQDVPLSIRSGGHGISGRSTNDGGIVIDLSRLNSITIVDQQSRRLRVQPGARWGDVAAALHPYGWALSSGDYGGVGVGGLATAGGIGWLAREHGLTIDHLRAVDLVLADGSVVHASETENPDLFWAVRGAGANFGIVVSFEFEVDEVADIGFGQLVMDASDTAGFLERWGAAVEAAPRDLTSFLIVGPPRRGQPAIGNIMAVVNSADPQTVIDRLQPLAMTAPLLQHAVQILPYPAIVNSPQATHQGQGEPTSRSVLIDHITPAFAKAAAELINSGHAYFFQIRSVGGAVADVPSAATAYSHRSANFSVIAFGANRTELNRRWDLLAEHSTGLYLSFETDLRPERITEAWPPATLHRLRALKSRLDPDNVFRDNFNITPAIPLRID